VEGDSRLMTVPLRHPVESACPLATSAWLRGVVFRLAWYGLASLGLVLCLPLLLAPPHIALRLAQRWARLGERMMNRLCGVTVEVRGLELLPDGPCLIAVRHQSPIEGVALFARLGNPVLVFKRELTKIPFSGAYDRHVGMLPLDRDGHVFALQDMLAAARRAAAEGRPLVVFPEGTRQPDSSPLLLKSGIAALYEELALPCVPVRVRTGHCWPKGSLAILPGHAVVEIGEALPPSLPRDEFFARLRRALARPVAES
jgi:1-acyl-sn-glycerol-3-phosphate acyltransferase